MQVNLSKCGAALDLMFGTDAEVFLADSDGNVIPASKVIPGKKFNPHILDNGVCHPDGLSLEVGCPPSETPEGMLTNLFAVIQEVKEKFLDPNGVQIIKPMAVDSSKVKGCTDEDLEFGCGSEYDVYSQDMYKESNRDTTQRARFSGFHIHIGYTSSQEDNFWTFSDAGRLIRVLDALVTKYGLETTSSRSEQYGGRGAFRIKPYGIEYRCMDCSVLTQPAKFERLISMLNEIPSAMEGSL